MRRSVTPDGTLGMSNGDACGLSLALTFAAASYMATVGD